MYPEFLLERFQTFGARSAFVWNDTAYSYEWLVEQAELLAAQLHSAGVEGRVVSLEAAYTPYSVALLFALLDRCCIVLLLDSAMLATQIDECLAIGQAEVRVTMVDSQLQVQQRGGETGNRHPLLAGLQAEGAAGLVLFSSGSTGKSKATVHHADRLLTRFERAGRPRRTIPFMLLDHIGGLNTLLQTLASGGSLHFLVDRSPEEVCRIVERYRIETLPVSPTFIKLLLLSEAYRDYDLSSLTAISYGSEVMPESTLKSWNALFPQVRAVQVYGMSELGVLSTQSKGTDSLLFAIRAGSAMYRVVDGMLEVKTETAMLGYLNAPSPFTEDGWMRTGDEAVLEGEYIRILGRRSEVINVGGEKVYPAEVENVLQQLACIQEVAVSAEPNAITGQMVKATVRLREELPISELRRQIWTFCSGKLPPFKIPQKIVITTDTLISKRMKKRRMTK